MPLPIEDVLLGKFKLANIPPAPIGAPQIELTSDIDVDTRLRTTPPRKRLKHVTRSRTTATRFATPSPIRLWTNSISDPSDIDSGLDRNELERTDGEREGEDDDDDTARTLKTMQRRTMKITMTMIDDEVYGN